MDELSNIQRSNVSADVGYPATVRACKADGKGRSLMHPIRFFLCGESISHLAPMKCLKELTLI